MKTYLTGVFFFFKLENDRLLAAGSEEDIKGGMIGPSSHCPLGFVAIVRD